MNTPIKRRAGQPVPNDKPEAEARFKCLAYLCDMTGQSCAATHVKARETQQMNREACIACPAGAARAVLLGLSDVLLCAALPGGRPCGQTAAPGKRFCEAHKHQRAGRDLTRAHPLKNLCPKCGNKMKPMHTPAACERSQARARGEIVKGKAGQSSGINWDAADMRASLAVMTVAELAEAMHVSENTVRVVRRARLIEGPDGRAVRLAACQPCPGWSVVDGPAGPALVACKVCNRVRTEALLAHLPAAQEALAKARAARGPS